MRFLSLIETSSDEEYLAAVERGDMETAQNMVNAAATIAGYTIGPAEHRTKAKELEGGAFDLSRVGSNGGGRTDFRRPAIWFAIPSKWTLALLAKMGGPPPYGENTIRAFIKPGELDYDKTESNGTRILGVTEPSRIKSADPVTYQDGEPIPLSQRFNPNSDNINY